LVKVFPIERGPRLEDCVINNFMYRLVFGRHMVAEKEMMEAA
jgi:hypothetical protein